MNAPRADLELQIRRALEGLRFGSVEIVVHDSRVVHIERRERFRLGDAHRSPGDAASPIPSTEHTERPDPRRTP